MEKLDIGIDLGTTSILIYTKNKGIVLNEPSVIATNIRTGKIIAVGKDAYDVLGKTPDFIRAVEPMSDGVISDYEATQKMIKMFIEKVTKNRYFRPRIAVCIPTNATEVESMAVIDAAHFAGARKVYLIEEPLAAAIGCGIDISKPNGNLIIDVGGGTADIAVISLNSKVVSKSIRLGGNYVSDKIKKFIQKKHNILLGNNMIENLKKAIASASDAKEEIEFRSRGRNLINGLPEFLIVTRSEITELIQEWATLLSDAIKTVLESTPPELTGDIYTNGGILTGGGSLIDGLAPFLENKLGFNMRVAENPIECVAIGTGNSFKYIHSLREGFFTPTSFDEKSY